MSTTISILGNTGREVELRYTPAGLPVANFSVASNTVRNTPNGKQKKTDWFNITAFGKVAETLAQNVRKGSHILVQGRLTFNPWLSRDGQPRVGADVVLQDFEFAGGRPREIPGSVGGGPEIEGQPEAMDAEAGETEPEEVSLSMINTAKHSEPANEPYAGQF